MLFQLISFVEVIRDKYKYYLDGERGSSAAEIVEAVSVVRVGDESGSFSDSHARLRNLQ